MTNRFFRRFLAPRNPPAGKASSFHLWWGDRREFSEVSVTLEVLRRPQVEELFFWAMQATFPDGAGAHLGLQHHQGYPGLSSVNWGGYDAAGQVLSGTVSELPSALGNANTRTFAWTRSTPYRLTIREGSGGWDGIVTDLATGEATTIRTLHAAVGSLRNVVVWSEVFAPCDHESAQVRWSDFRGTLLTGEQVTVGSGVVRYQRNGCINTNTAAVEGAAVQTTATARTTPNGASIRWIE